MVAAREEELGAAFHRSAKGPRRRRTDAYRRGAPAAMLWASIALSRFRGNRGPGCGVSKIEDPSCHDTDIGEGHDTSVDVTEEFRDPSHIEGHRWDPHARSLQANKGEAILTRRQNEYIHRREAAPRRRARGHEMDRHLRVGGIDGVQRFPPLRLGWFPAYPHEMDPVCGPAELTCKLHEQLGTLGPIQPTRRAHDEGVRRDTEHRRRKHADRWMGQAKHRHR